MAHEIIYITGMTCINCQKRIQTALTAQSGITNATVSYQLQTAEIDYDPNEIPLEQILSIIDGLGYSASSKKTSRKKAWLQILSELGLIAVLYFLLQYFGILNRLAPNSLATDQMGYGMLFVIGLITSVHCIAMCGGINLSQVLQKANDTHISRAMFQNALSYNIGRVLSYTITGGILGLIGALTGLSGTLQTSSFFQGLLKLLAGALMIVMGVNMLGLFPRLRRFHLPVFHFGKFFSKNGSGHKASRSSMRKTPFFVGLCNGLMPCGPLQSMQIIALASASPITGALSMFFFSLGTVPLMLGFGSIVASLGKRFTSQVLKCGAILVVVMGLSMMSQGTALSGIDSHVTSLFSTQNKLASSTDSNTAVTKDGVQYISSTLEPGQYPDITVKVGIPVNWTIHAEKAAINGCNYKVLLQDFDTECIFEEGDNVITFTPQKEGVYTYSCWMGMITAKIYVEG